MLLTFLFALRPSKGTSRDMNFSVSPKMYRKNRFRHPNEVSKSQNSFMNIDINLIKPSHFSLNYRKFEIWSLNDRGYCE
jgi:hypothetical protein